MGVKCLLEKCWNCIWHFIDDFNLGPVERIVENDVDH